MSLRDWVQWVGTELGQRERGQGLVEYALIISVVSVAATVLIMSMGPRIASTFPGARASLR